jgi:ubiquitin-protein ligase
MRDSPRVRRLRSDLKALQALQADSTILDFEAHGNPPESYVVRFHGQGVSRPDVAGPLRMQDVHEVHIRLGASYPCTKPEIEWRTPVYHPNISGSGMVCLGGYGKHWVPSLNLDELCEMLWDMVRYQNYDVNSPYNLSAANWARDQEPRRFPLDPRPIRDKLAQGPAPPKAARDVADEVLFVSDNQPHPPSEPAAARDVDGQDIFWVDP